MVDSFNQYIIENSHISYKSVIDTEKGYSILPDKLFELSLKDITKSGNDYHFFISISFWREYHAKTNKAKFNFIGEANFRVPTINGTLLDDCTSEEAAICIAECVFYLQMQMKSFFENKHPNLAVIFPLQSKEDILVASRDLLQRKDVKRTTIEYLKQIQRRAHNPDYNKICSEIDTYIPSLPFSITTTNKILRPSGIMAIDYTLIYKARENETLIPERASFKLPFKTLDEISIIPEYKKEKLTHFGRCNKPHDPRFYASTEYSAACIESITSDFGKKESPSTTCTVGTWKIIEPLNLAIVNYSEKALKGFIDNDKVRYIEMIEQARKTDENRIKQISEHNTQDIEHIKQILEIFTDEFAKIEINDDYDYFLTNYYCDHVFDRLILEDGSTKVDGILYPSVGFSYQHYNLVLHPRAMNKIKFINAMMVWCVYHEGSGNVQFIPLEQNVRADDKGYLRWRKFKWSPA